MRSITLQSRVQQKQALLSAEFNGETVMLNDRLAEYYGLDSVAFDIWQRLAQEVTVAQLVQGLVEVYAGDPDVIQEDVLELLETFAGKDIINIYL